MSKRRDRRKEKTSGTRENINIPKIFVSTRVLLCTLILLALCSTSLNAAVACRCIRGAFLSNVQQTLQL